MKTCSDTQVCEASLSIDKRGGCENSVAMSSVALAKNLQPLSKKTILFSEPINFVAGFLLSWSFLKSGSIFVPLLLHSFGNIAMGLFHLP